jgi:hypothetical protein
VRQRQNEVVAVTGQSALRRKARSGSASEVPAAIGGIRPADIASVEVTKLAAGRLGPDPVSLIVIALKPGARVPTRSGTP